MKFGNGMIGCGGDGLIGISLLRSGAKRCFKESLWKREAYDARSD